MSSPPPPPTAHDAALAQAVQAVADSVRASYKPPEELLVDPMMEPPAPATDVPPSSLTLSAADLATVVAQLGALSTAPGRLPPPPLAVLLAPPPVIDADTLVALHQQAISVLNIKALIPVTLDLTAGNYTRWRGMFLVVLGKYALTDHMLSDDPPAHPD